MIHDYIIIGTGPSGISAAWPLVQSGADVLVLDPSQGQAPEAPRGEYFRLRRTDPGQASWMVDHDRAALADLNASSPKLRAATIRPILADFAQANRIETENFTAVGSLATGGLSNAWGCGVARYDSDDLADFPIRPAELEASFAAVCGRIGLSGRSADALAGYFGLDDWADQGPPLDRNCASLERRYRARPDDQRLASLRLGRARVAVLARAMGDRQACDLSGLCLWGCWRGSLYSSRQELAALVKAGAKLRTGIVADHLAKAGDGWIVRGRERSSNAAIELCARRVVLAAGTLATTAIAWRTLALVEEPRRLLSTPAVAFLLLRPGALGSPPVPGPAFAQLSFVVDTPATGGRAHGSLFSPSHLPASEFVRRIPLSRRAARAVWRLFAPAAIVGNAFLSAGFSDHYASLTPQGVLRIRGGWTAGLIEAAGELRRIWRRAAPALGAVLLPGGFLLGDPGSDIHYAGTLPMRRNPAVGDTTPDGELAGAPGVYVADAASFPTLSPKPHTLTMMALADRLGRRLAQGELRLAERASRG